MNHIQTIFAVCRPFLQSVRTAGGLLLRGFGEQPEKLLWRETLKDRKPKNTPLFFHEQADNWFHEKFGVRYRSNVVICTGSWDTATGYGNVYAVFPIRRFLGLLESKSS